MLQLLIEKNDPVLSPHDLTLDHTEIQGLSLIVFEK